MFITMLSGKPPFSAFIKGGEGACTEQGIISRLTPGAMPLMPKKLALRNQVGGTKPAHQLAAAPGTGLFVRNQIERTLTDVSVLTAI